jgi:hypothetical protein
MDINNIVEVSVTRETRTVSQVGFGTICILGPNVNVASRLTRYSSLSSLEQVLIGGSSAPEYLAAQAIFSQSPRVTEIALGYQRGLRILTDDAGTYTAGAISAVVNGVTVSQAYDTDKNTTLTAFAAKLALEPAVDTAVYSSVAHTITITANSGQLLALSVSLAAITGTMTMVLSSDATEDPDDAYTAIRLYDDDFYVTLITSRDEADVLLMFAWAEANGKIFATASTDADIIDVASSSDTTSLAAVAKAAGYDRSFVMYHADAATTYPEAAAVGKVTPMLPGSYTLAFKSLSGVTRSLLSETQSYNARAKNALTYETVGAVNITTDGKVASGEFYDVIVFIDWLVARVKEAGYRAFVVNKKIPYDESGILSIRNAIEPPFEEGLSNSGISQFAYDADGVQIGGYYFTVPRLENISSVDKANRVLTGLSATCFLAGAIHKAQIEILFTL